MGGATYSEASFLAKRRSGLTVADPSTSKKCLRLLKEPTAGQWLERVKVLWPTFPPDRRIRQTAEPFA